ncbi:hypothetical protein VTJ49DRAFT_6929 [Mycothermus thermophilus]|uniref:Uncharacterized protein n=1 Tax=Humicola insolens TaxID=85995 RepID=A0ABR3VJ76_HUMIN
MPVYYSPPPTPTSSLPPSRSRSFSTTPSTTTTNNKSSSSSSRYDHSLSRSTSNRSTCSKHNHGAETKREIPYLFLGSIAAASLVVHKYWPKGFPYGEKEDWELSPLALRAKERRLREKAERAERRLKEKAEGVGHRVGILGRRGSKSSGGCRLDEGLDGRAQGSKYGYYGHLDRQRRDECDECFTRDDRDFWTWDKSGSRRRRERRGSVTGSSSAALLGRPREHGLDRDSHHSSFSSYYDGRRGPYIDEPPLLLPYCSTSSYRRVASRERTNPFLADTDLYPLDYSRPPRRYLLTDNNAATTTAPPSARYFMDRRSSLDTSRLATRSSSSRRGYYIDDYSTLEQPPETVVYLDGDPPAVTTTRARRASFDAGRVGRYYDDGYDWTYR